METNVWVLTLNFVNLIEWNSLIKRRECGREYKNPEVNWGGGTNWAQKGVIFTNNTEPLPSSKRDSWPPK